MKSKKQPLSLDHVISRLQAIRDEFGNMDIQTYNYGSEEYSLIYQDNIKVLQDDCGEYFVEVQTQIPAKVPAFRGALNWNAQ